MTQELTAESFPRRTRDRQDGFSLIEALIVIFIGMVLTGLAVPMVQSAIRSYTVNSAASNLSRMVQQARFAAIAQGRDACTLFAGNQFGVDANCLNGLEATEVRMQIPRGVTVSPTTGLALTGLPLPTPAEFSCTNYAVTFNTRGSKTFVCGTATGGAVTNILYLTGWGNNTAVTITGTGRARSWQYNGTSWQ